jgi:hypothetical protein
MKTVATQRPINLNAGEVRDIQAGQERVILKPVNPQPTKVSTLDEKYLAMRQDPMFRKWVLTFSDASLVPAMQAGHGWISAAFGECPFGVPGDQLWVRESFRYDVEHDNYYFHADQKGLGTEAYIALSGKPEKHFGPEDMPDCASRLTVEVLRIRACRLHMVGPEEAARAGYGAYFSAYVAGGEVVGPDGIDPLDDLEKCWGERYPNEPWESNPWVWMTNIKQAS